MTQKIQKKFLSQEIISYFDDQIDVAEQSVLDEKSRAEGQESAIRSEFAAADDAKLLEAKQFAQDQDALKLAEAKEYAELKVAEVKSEIMGGIPSSTLDTIAEIAEALASEQTATGAILSQLSGLESSKASKQELEDKATEILDIVYAEDLVEKNARQQADANVLAESKQYTDDQIAAIPAVDLTPFETIVNVDSKDAAKLLEAKAYTDAQIAAIPPVDISGKADKSYVDSQDAAIQSELDNLEGYAQDLRDDVDGHETRIVALENKVDGPAFSNEKIVVGSELGFIELSMEVKKIMSCAVGRLALHEGEDFDVSVVGGKSRLVWKGSLLAPSGEECIESGMNIFVVYAY
jgi:hypothetical protein